MLEVQPTFKGEIIGAGDDVDGNAVGIERTIAETPLLVSRVEAVLGTLRVRVVDFYPLRRAVCKERSIDFSCHQNTFTTSRDNVNSMTGTER